MAVGGGALLLACGLLGCFGRGGGADEAAAGDSGGTGDGAERDAATSAGDPGSCEPTESVRCECADGSRGMQTCSDDGVFLPCGCPSEPLDAGGAAGNGGAGGDADGGAASGRDAGGVFGGDAGSADAGAAEAGSVDAGAADAGSADAGTADAGAADAGGGGDAGPLGCTPDVAAASGVCAPGCPVEITVTSAPNLLVLLDASLSMSESLDPSGCPAPGCPAKIAIAHDTIAQLTGTYSEEIRWGLAMFPADNILDGCLPPTGVIPPGPNNAVAVADAIAARQPSGFTPIHAALSSVQSGGYLDDPVRDDYLLLISDGGETCGGDNAASAQLVADLAAAGVPTFVVGFGGGVDPVVLEQFAVAGGVPSGGGGTSYYDASSADDLEQALGEIAGRVVECTIAISETPPQPDAVWAFFDDVLIPRAGADGWTLDAPGRQVTFTGAACEQLRAGGVGDVDIVYGCPQPTP